MASLSSSLGQQMYSSIWSWNNVLFIGGLVLWVLLHTSSAQAIECIPYTGGSESARVIKVSTALSVWDILEKFGLCTNKEWQLFLPRRDSAWKVIDWALLDLNAPERLTSEIETFVSWLGADIKGDSGSLQAAISERINWMKTIIQLAAAAKK